MQWSAALSRPASILIVEDDAIVAFALDDYLRQRGHVVLLAASGQAAREALGRQRFDLILADLRLDGTDTVDGLDLAGESLRGRRVDHAIIVTAWSDDATVARAAVMGVAAVVKKPIAMAELAALVANIIRNGDREDP